MSVGYLLSALWASMIIAWMDSTNMRNFTEGLIWVEFHACHVCSSTVAFKCLTYIHIYIYILYACFGHTERHTGVWPVTLETIHRRIPRPSGRDDEPRLRAPEDLCHRAGLHDWLGNHSESWWTATDQSIWDAMSEPRTNRLVYFTDYQGCLISHRESSWIYYVSNKVSKRKQVLPSMHTVSNFIVKM